MKTLFTQRATRRDAMRCVSTFAIALFFALITASPAQAATGTMTISDFDGQTTIALDTFAYGPGWAWEANINLLVLTPGYNQFPMGGGYIFINCAPANVINLKYWGDISIGGGSNHYAISCEGALNISRYDADSGTLSLSTSGMMTALYAKELYITSGTLTVVGGGSGIQSPGIISISDSANVTVSANHHGIYSSDGSLYISTTGNVNITGCPAILVNSVSIGEGTVVISAKDTYCGAVNGNFTVAGTAANVTVNGSINGNVSVITVPAELTVNGDIFGDLFVGSGTATVNGTVYGTISYSGGTLILPPPAITTASLPNGTVGAAYNQTLTATSNMPVTWSIENGSLPDNLILDTVTGEISGTPTAAGTANFTVKAASIMGDTTQVLSITIKATTPTVYVTPDGAGDKDGSDWENAMDGLSNALEAARANAAITEIWVAAGTYAPQYKLAAADVTGVATTDIDKTFRLVKDVKIYGGFAGAETALSQRNPAQNVTVLSGDLGGGVKVRHVVAAVGNVGAALLDGFTVSDGNSTGTTWVRINVDETDYDNYQGNGGGIFCNRSAPDFANLIIRNNHSTAAGGGAFFCGNAAPKFTNVLFTANSSVTNGGGIYFTEQSVPVFTNVTVVANSGNIGGIYNDSETRINMRNSIVWYNTLSENNYNFGENITYSLVQDYNLTGEGNLNGSYPGAVPEFVDYAGGDYRLQSTSPCINAGNSTLNASLTDLAWNPRVFGGAIDMGAYEYAASTTSIKITKEELRILIDKGELRIENYAGGAVQVFDVRGVAVGGCPKTPVFLSCEFDVLGRKIIFC